MTPERLRAYILILVRDMTLPIAGIILSFYLVRTHQFAWWQTPFLAGMMMTPLVGRGGEPEPDLRPDRRPEAEG